jgi:Lon-like protease
MTNPDDPSEPSGTSDPTAEEGGSSPQRVSVTAKILVTVAVLLAIVGIAGAYIKLPYVIQSPGDATPVDDYLRIHGVKRYHHDGALLLLTVRVSNGRPNVWRFVEANLDDDSRIIGEKDYFGTAPRRKVERQSVQMMAESQLAAKQAALTRLGYDVTVTGSGARIEQVVPHSPAAKAGLRAGDVITAIDGEPVTVRDQVGQIVQAAPVGTTFSVTVRREHDDHTFDVTSGTAPSGDIKGKPYFGIAASTADLKFDFPVDISIDAGDISGPSGGLAFALTIIDDLTPGNLTGGAAVAVTGEIDGAGNVGEVGGVSQKAVAAREAGATLMIVPRAEVKDARTTAGDMSVVGVRTLADALKVLRRHGGAPLPAVPAA